MDMEKNHSPGEDWMEDVPAVQDTPNETPPEEGPVLPETPETPESAELPVTEAPPAEEDTAPAEESTDTVTSNTVFFSPVTTAAALSDDATQVLPSSGSLSDAMANKTEPEEEDPLAGLDELLRDNTSEDAAGDAQSPVETELTPEEIKALKKEIRRERRAARRARLDAEEAPDTSTFMRKLWYVLRLGDGLFGIPQILTTFVWLILIFAIGTSLGRTLWLCAADVLALGKTPHEITITIDEDDDLETISEKLHDAGLIRYPGLFQKFADLTDKGDNIIKNTSITFGSDHVYDYNALINALSFKGGATITLEVTIPEGYSCAQIFELLEKKGVCSAKALEDYCAEGKTKDYWFLQEIPEEFRKHKYGLEGFLFPDTYEFYMDDEPERVIEKFLDNFNSKFSQRMIDKFVAMLNITELDLSLYDVIIMASIVEKEKAADLEGYTIASVFYNRLRSVKYAHYENGERVIYRYLESDATIKYATDYYNKGELITDEQINASPYHSYKHEGLTPTPIANPGLASLDAALDPYSSDAPKDIFYFFVLNRDTNRHVFAKSFAEHQKNLRDLGYYD